VATVNTAPATPDGLNTDDPGIRQLAAAVSGTAPAQILLLHCGDLPGLEPGATRLVLDVREAEGSPQRCVSDVGAGLPEGVGPGSFELAAVWPRAHLGKDFSERCLGLGALALKPGGRLLCAVRKLKGGKSLGRTMKALFGDREVGVESRSRGYHLWVGRRGEDFDPDLARALCERTYLIEDPALGAVRLQSRPGVFCRRELDAGTRALIEVASERVPASAAGGARGEEPTRILDLCAGVGPLALWAAARWPEAQILAVESSARACALLRDNARDNGLDAQVTALVHDGMPSPLAAGEAGAAGFLGATDLVLMNPPTHADPETFERLLDLRAWLRPGGRALVVVNRPARAVELLTKLGASYEAIERAGYVVFQVGFGAGPT